MRFAVQNQLKLNIVTIDDNLRRFEMNDTKTKEQK